MPQKGMVKHVFAQSLYGPNVDSDAGVIKGVAVITEGMANGEVVDSTTIQQIMECAQTYEGGLKVNADHRSGVFAAAGYLTDFRIEGKTLRADLHILSTEVNRAKLLEMAATIPDTFGLSVSFSGPETVINGQPIARCAEIYSADLVANPAANPNGLFERTEVDGANKGKSMANAPATTVPPAKAVEPVAGADDSTLTPAQVLKQCKDMITSGFADHMANFTKMLGEHMSKIAPSPQTPTPGSDGFNPTQIAEHSRKMDATLKEFSAKIDAAELKLKEFEATGLKNAGENIAKEFAKTIGASPAVLSAITTGLREQETVGSEKFVELSLKHFAADPKKSKVKAMEAAMSEDPKAYEIFRSSGKNITWPKSA